MKRTLSILVLLAGAASAGPFSPAASQPGSTALAKDDPSFAFWASGAVVVRGPVEITLPDGALASFGNSAEALGPANADADLLETFPVVSLGDGGWATLSFPQPIANGPGPDFAVFENGFNDHFLELAFVEVSSDGVTFVRLPATSLTPTATQVGSFAGVDPSDLHNLAGSFRAGFGTPFDLAELQDSDLNLAAITHVRIIDVVGSIDPVHGSRDQNGELINDPYPTPFTSGGFDLDAVGVRHGAPGSYASWGQFYFGTETPPFQADLDRDGVPHGLEWALWCDPHAPSSPLKLAAGPSGITLRLRFHPTRLPGTLTLEGSDDFINWTTIAAVQDTAWKTVAKGWSLAADDEFPATISFHSASTPARYFRCTATP